MRHSRKEKRFACLKSFACPHFSVIPSIRVSVTPVYRENKNTESSTLTLSKKPSQNTAQYTSGPFPGSSHGEPFSAVITRHSK